MTMKPRDISQSQLWLDDDWAASSLSSLGSRSVDDESDSDSDDEEEELMAAQALEDSLECLNKLSSTRRTSTTTNNNKQSKSLSPPPRHSLTRSKPSMMSKRHTSVPGMASMRNSTTNTARNSKTSRSANGLVLLQSPMRKFRSNTSDSNLSSSRSCHSQRRRVSQANAKWDATCFQGRNNNNKIRRSAPTLHVSLGLCRHKQRQRSQQQQSYPEPDSVCSSKETRWSTSTHTRGGNSIVRCPKRQNSQDDLSLGDDCSSCCGSMASESTAGGSPNNKRRGRRPVRKEEGEVVVAAEEQGGDESAGGTAEEGDEDETTAAERNETAPAVADDSEQQHPPVPLVVKKTKKKKKKSKRRSPSPVPPSGPRIRPQMPHRQMSFKRQSAAVSMDNVIQEAMAAAQLCDTTDLSSVRAHSVTLPILARDIDNHSPMSAPPHRRSCSTTSGAQQQLQQPNSLVSLMSPFRSLSPPRQRHNLMTNNNSSAPLALDKLGMAADTTTTTTKNELATCASMTDLTMKQPRRRGSLLA